VITIEPFLTIGDREIVESKDGWTLRSAKGSLGAQFEHTFIVQRGEPIVLTLSG
jgi:methionyl aminopeptidase